MDRANTYSAEDLRAVSEDAKPYAFVNGCPAGSGIKSIEYSLNLDSSTAINIYLYVSEDYEGNVSAYQDGGSISIAEYESAQNRYKIQIGDIPAHKLGSTYVITVAAGKMFDLEISALSYVNTVLNKYTDNTEMCESAASIYNYYTATMNYRKSAGYKD